MAALSVTLSLLGLIVPAAVKPVLAAGEFASIAIVLLITRLGGRGGWHDRWLDQRTLAEELRCLAVSAPLGDLFLRGARVQDRDIAGRERRYIARRIGLPSARIDAAYLAATHPSLLALLDDQIGYVEREAGRMHRLEHRLRRLGGALFTITALVCAGVLAIEAVGPLLVHDASFGGHGLPAGVTVVSASLPAIGAAVYGIRMQGDFAGAAERDAALAAQLALLRRITKDEAPEFAALRRLIRRTAELLTNRLAKMNFWLVAIVAAALVDSLGAALDHALHQHFRGSLFAGLLPALAYVIKKLPDWLGGTGGSAVGGLMKRFAKAIALLAGILLYGLLAVGAAALVHHLAWDDQKVWTTAVDWPRLVLITLLAWLLAILSGRAEGFINLSSLHTLYSSRLTRAYLGGRNVERLGIPETLEEEHPAQGGHVVTRDPVPVNENHARDYIQPRVYGELDLPAPIHIINVTLNETIDLRSQIVARDRKGDIMSLEPGDIRIGNELADWSPLTNDPPDPNHSHAENVSLGQWIAISGAAASSGMGRMTSLGFALAFTFANVRLGYWWWAPKICRDVPEKPPRPLKLNERQKLGSAKRS